MSVFIDPIREKLQLTLEHHPRKVITGLIVLLILFLELFTPAAPLQRCAGFWVAHMPRFGLSMLVGSNAADRFENLDTVMNKYIETRTIYDANGEVIAKADDPDSIPSFLKNYLISIENGRYDDTYVIDWSGFMRAVATDISSGGFAQGASGIIQQFSRGIILKNDRKFWTRKGKEALISLGLSHRYSHEKLLNFYMASVFLGSFSDPAVQIRGLKRGAYEIFDKDISEITKPEALALVALISRPNLYLKNTQAFKHIYLRRAAFLRSRNIISQADYQDMIHNVPVINISDVKKRALFLENRKQIADQIEPTDTGRGPIYSTIDLKVTALAHRTLTSAIQNFKKKTGIDDLDGFIVVAHYDSILAAVGSAEQGARYMNNLRIISAWRPGSLVKPLIYSEYISQGGDISKKLPAEGPKDYQTIDGTWTVKNYSSRDNSPSKQPAIMALARSNNVAAAYLAVNYGDSLYQRVHKLGVDSTFTPYPATFIGADAPVPLNLFRLLQAYVPPYGRIPHHFITEKNDVSPYDSLFSYETARETAFCLTYALKDPMGTLHFAENQYHWSDADFLGKTGTAQENTSAGLFIVRPNGLSVFMGIFSRSGKSLTYTSGGAIQGASLVPYMQHFFASPAITKRIKGHFDFNANEYLDRDPLFVQKIKSIFHKVGSFGKRLWESLK